MKYFLFAGMILLVSCGDVATVTDSDIDRDRKWTNDENIDDSDTETIDEWYDEDSSVGDTGIIQDDNIYENDDEIKDVVSDDYPDDDTAEDLCGNSVIDEGEICDNQFKNCTEIDPEKYIGGKAKCLDDCSGWETGWCDLSELNECKNGERKCEGESSYIQCGNYDSDVYTEWSEPIDCDGNKICENGQCECETHFKIMCEGRFSYWFDSCGQKEELNKDCGTNGYVGDSYCKNGHVYAMYARRECYTVTGDCWESIEEVAVKHCYDLGCTNGDCNDGYTFQMTGKSL